MLLAKRKIAHSVHAYAHDPRAAGYGLEAAARARHPARRAASRPWSPTSTARSPWPSVPVSGSLDLKALAAAAGGKRAAMADPAAAERTTGYVLGGISPLGQRKRLPTYIDASAEPHDTVYVSAGRRGLEIELAPADLAALTGASFAPIATA